MRQAHSALLGSVALALAGCATAVKAQPRLLDGGRPAPPRAALARLRGPLALGRVRVAPARAADPTLLRACLHRFAPLSELPAENVVVERVGVAGASLTFRDPRGGFLLACDTTRKGDRFCGGSAGLLRRGQLVDPRLDIACRDRRSHQVGFAWITPLHGARWIAVEQRRYVELYKVAGGLPVRVTTSEVEVGSSAVFRVREYRADGRELSRSVLEAQVAG